MRDVLRSRSTKSGFAELVKSQGFMGGITYELYVDKQLKAQSSDRSYIEREYDNLW